MAEQADGRGNGDRARKDIKRRHRRTERHKTKQNPERPSEYKKYRGYHT